VLDLIDGVSGKSLAYDLGAYTTITNYQRVWDTVYQREQKLVAEWDMPIWRYNDLTKDEFHVLLVTSLPWAHETFPIGTSLERLWESRSCFRCQTVVNHHAVGVGNLNPYYLVLGIAPGVGDGELPGEQFDRVMVYGSTSTFVRKAFNKVRIYQDCWFSNLLKCSTPANRSPLQEEIENCFPWLLQEIMWLRPKVIIALGRDAQSWRKLYERYAERTIDMNHPQWWLKTGKTFEDFAEQLKEKLNHGRRG